MLNPGQKVIPIRNSIVDKVVELAFAYWRERFGLRDGSPQEDLLRAHRELSSPRTGGPKPASRLFLVPRPPS
jgi:hypothetical protein